MELHVLLNLETQTAYDKSSSSSLCVTLFMPGDNVLMHASELCYGNLPFLGTMRDYSQLSLRQTALEPALSVCLREMSVL